MLYNVVGFCLAIKQTGHNYIYIYIYLLPFEPPYPTYHPSSSQSARLGSLRYTATSHYLFILYMSIYIFKTLTLWKESYDQPR